jgi:hypothetical protein
MRGDENHERSSRLEPRTSLSWHFRFHFPAVDSFLCRRSASLSKVFSASFFSGSGDSTVNHSWRSRQSPLRVSRAPCHHLARTSFSSLITVMLFTLVAVFQS